MDFKSYLKEAVEQINKQLKEYLDQEIEEAQRVSAKLTPLVSLFADQSQRGKRLRGCLVKLGFELVSTDETQEIYKASLAYELIQTALLAHDDIVDRSLLRRGQKTMYQALGGDHYGISQTIILGDVGIFLAFRIIVDSNFPEDRKLKALNYFNQSLLKTASGEMLDIEASAKQENFDEKDAIAISHLKTAHYTIIGPMQLGASLAGGDEELLDNIEQFGKNLGIAFQIQDDILGVFGSENELGKSVTSDIEEGKNTLLITEALSKADNERKEFLEQKYGHGEINSEELEKIREIFIKTGALDYSRQKAVEYVSLAKQVIPKLTQNEGKRLLLNELADYLVNRRK
jgi:geranylgeranyl diphosphate synthase, type I